MLPDAVSAAAWIAGGLLAGAADGSILRFGDEGEAAFAQALHRGGVTRLRPRPDGRSAASAGEDGRVLLWDPATGETTAELAAEASWVEHLDWAADGRVLAAAAGETIHLWRDGQPLGLWSEARRRVLAMAWAPDGRRLATAANKGLCLWRLGGPAPVQLLEFPGAPVAAAWAPSGKALAVGTQDGFLHIWHQGDGRPARQLTMRGYPGKVACLAWHPRRPQIATAGGPEVVLWPTDPGAARKAQPLQGHGDTVTALAYAPGGALLASGDRGGRLCLWDAKGLPMQIAELGDEVTSLSWGGAGERLAAGTRGGLLQVFGGEEHRPAAGRERRDSVA